MTLTVKCFENSRAPFCVEVQTVRKDPVWWCCGARIFAIPALPVMAADAATFNVRDQGAKGDGKTLDTSAINQAIEACSASGGGTSWLASNASPGHGFIAGTSRW
jgi:hypothetical protein